MKMSTMRLTTLRRCTQPLSTTTMDRWFLLCAFFLIISLDYALCQISRQGRDCLRQIHIKLQARHSSSCPAEVILRIGGTLWAAQSFDNIKPRLAFTF